MHCMRAGSMAGKSVQRRHAEIAKRTRVGGGPSPLTDIPDPETGSASPDVRGAPDDEAAPEEE